MSKIAKLSRLPKSVPQRPPAFRERSNDLSSFSAEERRFIEHSFEDFDRRGTSRGYQKKSRKEAIKTLTDFFSYTGLGPWNWTEESFDDWNSYLVNERGIRHKSQSTYQNHFRSYQGFVTDNDVTQKRCQVTFGCRIQVIATKYNCIVHKSLDGTETGRRNFTQAEETAFMAAIRSEYDFKANSPNKGLFAAGRDMPIFKLFFDEGLRADELLGIDTHHFDSHPDRPECGRFAKLTVWGKAPKGEPKKKRVVGIHNVKLANILKWYDENIRPLALHNCDALETAFFLSERGNRLTYSALWERFQRYKEAANLGDETGLVIHSTRHSSVTDDLDKGIPVAAVQKKHGHVSLGTTGGYSHTTDQYVEESYEAIYERRRSRLSDDTDDSDS